jgi:hypothetical protein
VLDCAVGHAWLPSPHERAKFALPFTLRYVGPVYPALHVQFQIDVEPFAEALVDTHAVQAEKPTLSEYVFAGHSWHADAPGTALYLPSSHAVHGSPLGPLNPTMQKQSPTFTLPSGDDVYAGHMLHAHDPVVSLYLPTSHLTQGPPPGPVYPTSQAQSTIRPIPGSAAELGGHSSQSTLPSGDHSPAGHDRHVSFAAAW